MDIDEYQKKAHSFAKYKEPTYPILGLAEEAGEVCGKIAKHFRAKGRLNWDDSNSELAQSVKKELGDVCWFVAELCTVYGFKLEEVMEQNISKLQDRLDRGVICGSGDNR